MGGGGIAIHPTYIQNLIFARRIFARFDSKRQVYLDLSEKNFSKLVYYNNIYRIYIDLLSITLTQSFK